MRDSLEIQLDVEDSRNGSAKEHEAKTIAKGPRAKWLSSKRFPIPMISLAANEKLQASRLRMMQRLGINESIIRRPESIFSDSSQLMSVNSSSVRARSSCNNLCSETKLELEKKKFNH